MSVPLSFLDADALPKDTSLGQHFGQRISQSSIGSLLDCLSSTDLPAIYSPDVTRPPLLHKDLQIFVSNFALPHAPHRNSLARNDRVMVVLPAGPENAVALLALSTYHSCAPVNASCTSAELKDDATRLHAKAIITTKDIAKNLDAKLLQDEIGCEVIYLQPRDVGPAGLFDLSVMGAPDAILPEEPREPHGLDDISLILHTSGTSGKKKVVRYSLRTLLVGTWCVVHSWNLQATDINLNMMPLFHVGGIVRNLLAPVLSGGSSIMCPGFDPHSFWSLATQLKATWYYAAPTVHHAILSARKDAKLFDVKHHIRMICNAAGGLLPSLALELQETFGSVILPSYGMTECMPIATPLQDYKLDRPGCSGIACGPELSIRNPNDIEGALPAGKSGSVCVRGLPAFEGYEVSPDLSVPLDTSAFSSGGWFDSGDVGYMDEDGYLYITGRSKEIINKGGEVISPFEVEEAVITAAKHLVKNTLAFSVDHDVLQEAIGLAIVPNPARPRISLQQLHDLLKGHLHPSKWPFVIIYMDDIPKNSAGKPLRIGLSRRLGLSKLSDEVPVLQRHYEAQLPADASSLSVPIPCSKVVFNANAIVDALVSINHVQEIALRPRAEGNVDVFVSVVSTTLDVASITSSLSSVLPGYALPHRILVLHDSLRYTRTGDYDFEGMEAALAQYSSNQMTKCQLIIRDIISDLLNLDASHVSVDSDFFLLGGNSLLLGKLAYRIRKQTGVNIAIADLFTHSSMGDIAMLLGDKGQELGDSKEDVNYKSNTQSKANSAAPMSSTTAFSLDYDFERDAEFGPARRHRGSEHPLSLIVQAFPFIFFYPLKSALTWSIMLFMLSYFAHFTTGSYWDKMISLATSILIARVTVGVLCPIGAILFKWVIIGRYKPGTYQTWSIYYLRWWLSNQALRCAGRGIFSSHPALIKLYYRLLGAKIGKDVYIDDTSKLYEVDLLTLEDGCHIDAPVLRGFTVEREGYIRLAPITIGQRAFLNVHTFIAPGATIESGAVYGPHASSFDKPSPKSFAAYNRTLILEPHLLLKVFVAWPIILTVLFISYIPWALTLFAMIHDVHIGQAGLNDLERVITWFSSGDRVAFHAVSRVVRALFRPLVQVALGILVKRMLGLNKGELCAHSKRTALRHYINSRLLSQEALNEVFSIVGTHYEVVSMVYRAMGAKIGKHVYWPGSGIYCPDPELLEIGDNVVFGAFSFLFTSDRLGSGKIVIEDGAMVADRVVLLPGSRVGKCTVMGSGALGKRNGIYEAGSTWLGNERGEAVCFGRRSKEESADEDTTTPFARGFYQGKADYFVYPYWMVLILSIVITALSAAYWSISAVAAAQLLRQLVIHYHRRVLFHPSWYRLGILYGFIAGCFVVVLNIQGLLAMAWVIVMKWIVIGRRKEGRYDWDKSSYCQRWQLDLVLSRFLHKGFGNGGVTAPLTGSAYVVWFYRALGSKIGENCAIWAGGEVALMTEPDLVEIGDEVNLDDCSVVAHLNSRGHFSLNRLKIGHGSAMRMGSRLLSGASMEDNSMLCEHTLLTSGDVADSGESYAGWPAKQIHQESPKTIPDSDTSSSPSLTCPICRGFPRESTVTECGHLFCHGCISDIASRRGYCPVCFESCTSRQLRKVHLSFITGSPPYQHTPDKQH